MDFDFGHLPVPFRMQPGLARIGPEQAQLTPLQPGSRLEAEKRAVVEAGQDCFSLPGFDASPALATLDRLFPSRAATAPAGAPAPSTPSSSIALRCEEDLAILDGATGTLPWLCVCVPSHWAPEDKLGMGFAALHAPVADNQALMAAANHLVRAVTDGRHWQRHVWTVTPDPGYDQHPRRIARRPWPDDTDLDTFAARCHLRVERQTFIPVDPGEFGARRQAIFAIRVMIQPLVEAISSPERAQRLHDSLATMTPAVLDYKNLRPARERLLAWLLLRAVTT